MATQAALVLNTLTYAPEGANGGILTWMERSGGVWNSFSKLTQSFRSGVGALKRNILSWRLIVPTVAITDDACACTGEVLRTSSVNCEVWLDSSATAAERLDLYNRFKDLVASDAFKNGITNLDPVYA